MLAYLLAGIFAVPISWAVSFVIGLGVTALLRKLIPVFWILLLNGLIEGFLAFGIIKILFRWSHTPFSFIAVTIVGVEFGLLYADGIFRRGIGAEIPMAIGTMSGLLLLPLLFF